MISEWLKVMLDEIARKRAQAHQDQIELERRRDERAAPPASGGRPDDSAEG